MDYTELLAAVLPDLSAAEAATIARVRGVCIMMKEWAKERQP